MGRKPRLTLRTTSGDKEWKSGMDEILKPLVQNTYFYGGKFAEDCCKDLIVQASKNIVSNKTYHLKYNSGDTALVTGSKSDLVAYKAYFDTTEKPGGTGGENFNYAFRVHEDGTSANFRFLAKAYDANKKAYLEYITEGLRETWSKKNLKKIGL